MWKFKTYIVYTLYLNAVVYYNSISTSPDPQQIISNMLYLFCGEKVYDIYIKVERNTFSYSLCAKVQIVMPRFQPA